MVGTSVIALGLQPDVSRDTVSCPEAKRRLLLEQMSSMVSTLEEGDRCLERKSVERLTGRLSNLAQLFPEINTHISHAYAISNARYSAGNRSFLINNVQVGPKSQRQRRAGLLNLFRTASDALEDNSGVALALEAAFSAPNTPGVLTVTSDVSGDTVGGDAGAGGFSFHLSLPRTVFVTSELWPSDMAAALAESARQPSERSNLPRLSMPAAELFTVWACAGAALQCGNLHFAMSAIISVGDCLPASDRKRRH